MSTNALRQPVVDRPDLDLGLEHPETPFDVGEGLVAADDFTGPRVRSVRHLQELGVHHARMCQCALVDGVGEQFAVEIDGERLAAPS